MLKRLLRVITGLIFIFTIPITILPFLIAWIITGRNFMGGIMSWIFFEEYDED